MRTSLALALALGTIAFTTPAVVSAATLSGSAPQTSDSQDFVFNFAAEQSNGTAGVLTINARGDYGRLSSEVLTFDIDGVVSGGPFGAFPDVLGPGPDFGGVGGAFESVVIHSTSPDDYEFTKKITISGADMLAITSDNFLSISLFTGSGVTNLNNLSFVSVELDYGTVAPIPLPAASIPLLTALGGLALMRRRRSKQA